MPPFSLQKSIKNTSTLELGRHLFFDRFLHGFFIDFPSIWEANLDLSGPLRRPQDGPRCAQDAPRRSQDGPKMAKSSLKTATRRLKTPPRRPQDGPKRLPGPPRFPQDAPGPPQTPQNPPGPAPGTPKKANLEWEQGRPRPHKSTHQLHSPPASSAVAESRGSATG